MEILLGIWTCLLVAWSIIGAYLLREIAQQRRALGAQLALVQIYRHANSSPFDLAAGMVVMPRGDSHFYVGEGKPLSSQHPGWPPNVGDIRDDPRRRM